jgi:hypothetical protein
MFRISLAFLFLSVVPLDGGGDVKVVPQAHVDKQNAPKPVQGQKVDPAVVRRMSGVLHEVSQVGFLITNGIHILLCLFRWRSGTPTRPSLCSICLFTGCVAILVGWAFGSPLVLSCGVLVVALAHVLKGVSELLEEIHRLMKYDVGESIVPDGKATSSAE